MLYVQLDSNGVCVSEVETSGSVVPNGAFEVQALGNIGKRWNGVFFESPSSLTPPSVTPRQFRQALTRTGLRSGVEAFVASADQDTKDWYEYSNAFERSNPVLIASGHGLGKTDAEIDALFVLAATL